MENKPWWFDMKTGDLVGLRVRVKYHGGAIAEGVINKEGFLDIGYEYSIPVAASYLDEEFTLDGNAISIDRVYEDEHERVCTYEAREGDICVCTTGNRFTIDEIAKDGDSVKFHLRVDETMGFIGFWLRPGHELFDHVERRKSQAPTHDGIWRNRKGNLLLVAGDHCEYIRANGKWRQVPHIVRKDMLHHDAPWTEWHGDKEEV